MKDSGLLESLTCLSCKLGLGFYKICKSVTDLLLEILECVLALKVGDGRRKYTVVR